MELDKLIEQMRQSAGGNECSYVALAADELENLRDLLRTEQRIALRTAPFYCQQIECCRFNQRIRAGDCKCYDEQARVHRDAVRRAVGE